MKSVATRTLGLLGSWSTNRHPSPADSRHIIGSWAAKSALQYFAVEYLVHLTWNHYDYFQNVISALGARRCDIPAGCGSSFVIMDLSFMALGVGALVAASLITSTVLRVGGSYPKFLDEMTQSIKGHEKATDRALVFRHLGGEHFGRPLTTPHRLTTAVRISMGVTGLALIGVGAMPDDYMPFGHNLSTSIVVVGSVATLTMLGLLWRKPRPKTAVAMLCLAAISAIGAVGFGFPALTQLIFKLDLNWGLTGLFERLVVYGFIFGLFGMGLALTNGAHQPSAEEVAAKMEEAIPPEELAAPVLEPVRARVEPDSQMPVRAFDELGAIPQPVPVHDERDAYNRTPAPARPLFGASRWIQAHRPRRRS